MPSHLPMNLCDFLEYVRYLCWKVYPILMILSFSESDKIWWPLWVHCVTCKSVTNSMIWLACYSLLLHKYILLSSMQYICTVKTSYVVAGPAMDLINQKAITMDSICNAGKHISNYSADTYFHSSVSFHGFYCFQFWGFLHNYERSISLSPVY